MLDGWQKLDPPSIKKLPVEVDIPNWLVEQGLKVGASDLSKAIGDLSLIAFYYLLRVGEYTVKSSRNQSKQTQQFKVEDVTFFRRDSKGRLRQLNRKTATDAEIMTADSATLKLDNQKNGWRGVCVNQHANGDATFCPVRALGRRVCYIRQQSKSMKCFLSAYWLDGKQLDINDNDIRDNLKWAATMLDYPSTKGIPIDRIDTHSLRCGGANAMSLAGYSDRHIMKMGRWRSVTFMEYIRDELDGFSEGISKSMSKTFGFVNIAGGAFTDITNTILAQ